MSLSTIVGLGGHALLITAIVLRLGYAVNLKDNHRYILISIGLLLALTPFGDLPAAQVTRGIFGDLSITSLVLLVRFILLPQAPRAHTRELFILVVIAGLLFYPAALGLGMLDPYQWGYLNTYRGIAAPMILLSAIVGILLLAVARNNTVIMLCITGALAAFTLGIMESRNIWDYLIDPLVVTYGLTSLGIHSVKHILGKLRAI
jgi:hypothetical protein